MEATIRSSNPTVSANIDVDVSVESSSNASSNLSGRNIPIDVQLLTTTSDNQHIDVEMDVSNSLTPNIDVQIVVSPMDISETSNSLSRSVTPRLDEVLRPAGNTDSATGYSADVSHLTSPLSQCSLTDGTKHTIAIFAQVSQ